MDEIIEKWKKYTSIRYQQQFEIESGMSDISRNTERSFVDFMDWMIKQSN